MPCEDPLGSLSLHESNFIIFIFYVSIFHISHMDKDYFNTISKNQELN